MRACPERSNLWNFVGETAGDRLVQQHGGVGRGIG
jgi:hypothetical protein